MNKNIMIFVAFLALSSGNINANAQDNNPNSAAYHAIHNPQSPYYVDPGRQATTQQPPRPTGYWEKTWGAIATSKSGGALGTALGAPSESEAARSALADCQAKGGVGCEAKLAYHNQCAVMVVGILNSGLELVGLYRAASIAEASADGMRACKVEKGTNCRVYYSACTEPVFHRY